MFIELFWKKDGKENKTCLHISKLYGMTKALEEQGIRSWFKTVPENS